MKTSKRKFLLWKSRRLIFSTWLILVASLSFSQISVAQVSVGGKVTDPNGVGLPGVSVVVKGTNRGTVADAEGNYSISASREAVLVFSYLGFQSKEETVGSRTTINVTMHEDAQLLDDVVVVGFGVQKKVNLTGAIGVVKTDELVERQGTVAEALQGKIPGMTIQQTSGEPGSNDISIRIRGIGSINSSQAPLILVDGVEMDMNQVDPNMIESISVLKDAASASIYGSRASNGVVLVTTKRAKENQLKVSYNGYMGSQSATNLPNPVSAVEYMQLVNQANTNGGDNPTYPQATIDDYINLGPDNINRYDTDWKSKVIKDYALIQNHALNISGGSDAIRFNGTGGYYRQNGLIENNYYERFSLRMNTDMKFNSWLRASVDADLRKGHTRMPALGTPKAIIQKAFTFPSIFSGINADGTWGFGRNGDNPIARAESSGLNNKEAPEYVLTGSIYVEPVKGLEWQTAYSVRNSTSRVSYFVSPYDTYEGGVFKTKYPAESSGSESWSETKYNYFRTQVTYDKSISDHSFKILGGFSSEEWLNNFFNAGRQNYRFPGYEYLNNGDPATATNGGAASELALAAVYGRLNYDYKAKYLLEINGRYDGSSRFQSGNRWGFFPSFSAGWRISEESFMESIRDQLSNLKIRASWGQLGNQNIADPGNGNYYPYTATIEPGYSYWFDKQLSSGGRQIELANSNISWEKSTQLDFGIDMGLLNNRLGIVADWYKRNITDMLVRLPIPYAIGMNAPFQNVGEMENKGWELALNWEDKSGDFKYNAGVTLSDVQNKIIDVKGQEILGTMQEGYAYGSYYGLKAIGYFTDQADVDNSPEQFNRRVNTKPGYIKYADISGPDGKPDGVVNDLDREVLGNPFPRYEFGINMGAKYKGFDLNVFFQGVGKRDVLLSGQGIRPFFVGSTIFDYQKDYWTPENQNAAYPILLYDNKADDNYRNSSHWVKDGKYLRLKNLVIGYTLPKKVLNYLKVSHIRCYLSGQNLITWDNYYDGFDPEIKVEGGAYGGEFYPIMRTFSFGLEVRF